MSVKAVLFDLDDTLYKEMTFVASGFRAVAAHLVESFHWNSQELFEAMMGALSRQGRGKIFDNVLEQYGVYDPHLVDELVNVYRSHAPQIHLFPDVAPTFQALEEFGARLGVITDGMHSVQKNKVAALNLEVLVDVIIYTDERGRDYWKPHPIAFQDAVKALAIEPDEAVYVGNDPSKDFAGANFVGMLTVHLCREGDIVETSCEADIHIADLPRLIQAIGLGETQNVRLAD